jgi:hypothetical protein
MSKKTRANYTPPPPSEADRANDVCDALTVLLGVSDFEEIGYRNDGTGKLHIDIPLDYAVRLVELATKGKNA